MTVRRVEQRLRASEFLKDHLRSESLQVISQEATKKAFEYYLCQKMTRLAQKKISVSMHYVQDGQKDGRKKTKWF